MTTFWRRVWFNMCTENRKKLCSIPEKLKLWSNTELEKSKWFSTWSRNILQKTVAEVQVKIWRSLWRKLSKTCDKTIWKKMSEFIEDEFRVVWQNLMFLGDDLKLSCFSENEWVDRKGGIVMKKNDFLFLWVRCANSQEVPLILQKKLIFCVCQTQMEIKEFSLVCVRFDSKLIFCFFSKSWKFLRIYPSGNLKQWKFFFATIRLICY